ncbi:hypothetical protein P5G65_25615 [Paenibacillus chondroitinus]|uniref:Uncharacterized protein n=1 Tax=Paenibacillus chondroitinus TaxID=59842 RepID=A0ABU6DIY7_9BACL|nr:MULTISPECIES: hypothetical protein [Paenibacillus]MCY9662760.1 hypothetical protein [Paenibacillus anseongense]MEB4797287.1 hypothetical protein [Paenibacillus chondroitinus]
MRKQLMVLMGAAILAASTSGIVLPRGAYADEAVTGVNSTAQTTTEKPDAQAATIDFSIMYLNNWLSKLDVHTAEAAKINTSDFSDLLHNGSSLATASGLALSELSSSLIEQFGIDTSNEVKQGTLTDEEAANLQQQFREGIASWVQQSWPRANAASYLPKDGKSIIQNRLNHIISDAATASAVAETDIRQALQSGDSIADATGMDAQALDSTLNTLLGGDLDAAVNAGSLKADQRDQLAVSGADQIWQTIEKKGYDEQTTPWMEKYGQALLNKKLDPDMMIQAASAFAGKDYQDIMDGLAAGQSLVTASGLASADLSAQLLDAVSRDLDNEWNAGNLSAQLRDQLKKSAAEAIDKAIDQDGYGQAANGSSNHVIAAESIQALVEDSANYAEAAVTDLRQSLADDHTLVEATGKDESDLSSYLQQNAHAYIKQAVEKGWLNAADQAATESEADSLVQDAINRRGYKDQVDVKQYLANRADRVIDDVASVSGIETADLLKNLDGGKSIAQAANQDPDSLLYNLLKKANQEINGFAAAGAISKEDAAKLKADYGVWAVKYLSAN